MGGKKIHTIYDRIGKRCISLSKRSKVQLINGLYDKHYPEDSEVDYNWTEHHDDDLRKTLADTIVTINHSDSYHIEMQMTVEEDIVLRVFEYGFGHAMKVRDGAYRLRFSSPMILYLCGASADSAGGAESAEAGDVDSVSACSLAESH